MRSYVYTSIETWENKLYMRVSMKWTSLIPPKTEANILRQGYVPKVGI